MDIEETFKEAEPEAAPAVQTMSPLRKFIYDAIGYPPWTTSERCLSASEYVAEAELHGRHVYWHGALNREGGKTPPKIETENAQRFGSHPCFFFTTHFGYALSYVYPDKADVELDDSRKRAIVYKPFSKFTEKIPMNESLIAFTDMTGWIYPMSLPAGINIFLAGALNDKRKLQSMIANSEYKSFYPDEASFLRLFGRLAKEDWFFLDNEKQKYGFDREGLLEFMKSNCNYAGFFGFHNFETENKLSSIGMFKNKMNVLKVGKPFKVEYKDGFVLVSENY